MANEHNTATFGNSGFTDFGIDMPEILLPKTGTDLCRWSVIACDQFTSEPEYWESVDRFVGTSPSTLRLVLPECYLGNPDTQDRISSIHRTMTEYLESGVLAPAGAAFVLVVRDTEAVTGRAGLLAALDLDQYDFTPGSKSLVRATEGTIVERLPSRIRVREHAAVELPHILVLVDDPEMSIIEPLVTNRARLPLLYDTELMEQGGRVRGYRVDDPASVGRIRDALARLADPARFEERYHTRDIFLFAAGDGNHSLAAAKSFWESLKSNGAPADHPARWALVELVNIHSPALPFAPIHRLLQNTTFDEFLRFLRTRKELHVVEKSRGRGSAGSELAAGVTLSARQGGTKPAAIVVSGPDAAEVFDAGADPRLPVALLQAAIDDYIAAHPSVGVDYVHGRQAVERLAGVATKAPETGAPATEAPAAGTRADTTRAADGGATHVGIILPPIDKALLFPTVIMNGVLPRKAFSLGEAREKRYYLEARDIRGR